LEKIMSDTFSIDAQPRSDEGKGASRRLRRQGLVPGIIYGGAKKPEMISLVHNELVQHLEHEAFYSHILTVNVGEKAQQVILKDLQRHPAKPFVMHVDFQRVSAKKKLKTHVPIHFVGEDVAPGIKMGGAASHHVTDVEITCLPKDLPEYIEVDLSQMEVGGAVHLSELQLPAGVEIPALAQGSEQDLVVVNIHSGHGSMEVEEGEGAEEGEAEAGAAEPEGGEE
jgi:large subunit ribosomal protein L25